MGEDVVLRALRTRHLGVLSGCLSGVAHLPLISLALSLVELNSARFEVFDGLVEEVGVWAQPKVLHNPSEVGAALGVWLEHDG
jgi:hypothetical protein